MERLQPPPGRQVIQAYGPGGFTVAGARREGSLLILPDRMLSWAVRWPGEVSLESLEPLREAAGEIEILVLGLGSRFEPLPPALQAAIRAWGPIPEPMATAAACRTYNILLVEGRSVAAALIALPEA